MLSSEAESDCPGRTSGRIFARSSPNTGDAKSFSRAFSAFRLPFSVLISPLCASMRKGWARSQVGKVFVE